MISKYERFGFESREGDYKDLDLYQKGPVALIALHKFKDDRRASRESANHLDPPLIDELMRALDLLEQDHKVVSVLLASAQLAAFCRGAKIELLLTAREEDSRSFIDKAQGLTLRIHGYSKPVIALIDGFAMGGGLELIMSCDYRISSNRETVAFGLPEASLGIIPAMGGTLNLRRLTQYSYAEDILLHGRADILPQMAEHLGIVDKVVSPGDLLDEAWDLATREGLERTSRIGNVPVTVTAEEIRREIKEYLAVKEDKPLFGTGVAPLSEALLHLHLKKTSPERFFEGLLYEKEIFLFLSVTNDCREGVTALTEGRMPVFKGV